MVGSLALSAGVLTSCDDDDTVTVYTDALTVKEGQSRAIEFGEEVSTDTIRFTSRIVWTAEVTPDAPWLTVSTLKGSGGTVKMALDATANTSKSARSTKIIISASGQTEEFTVTQAGTIREMISPEDIPNYDKFFNNSEHGGEKMLLPDSKFSFYRYKESEHFFVFWDKYFGDDPNGPEVAEGDRVDVDDLLVKAEQFFNTNINTLGMAVLGQGKSYLDQYKMQIYLLDPTPEWWVATGSGYDNTIGALWVTPATCQPVGSTIAHEIGHSFQYQVYCDKLLQGATDDSHHGFRYGFIGPDGSGDGGCAFWEQCAQWQAHRDYPDEQFTTYNFDVWVKNCHRHFHHEWMRYASYWLQSYWVEKQGISAYGRIWRESEYPEDAIETYTRLYNNGNWQATREELYDYAARMATYDMDILPAIKTNYINTYKTTLLKNDEGYYQPALLSCPGATGFNVIELKVPDGGGKISVDFKGLESGAPLLADDAGVHIDGDGNATTYTTNSYNSYSSPGWRYGFVAYDGTNRTYSPAGKDANGTLSFDVPANTTRLMFVVQGSPETYISQGWDENPTNDEMFPYAVKFNGTNVAGIVDIDYDADPTDVEVEYVVNCDASHPDYAIGTIDLGANPEICQAFVMTGDVMAGKMQSVGRKPAEGKVTIMNKETSGTLVSTNTANNGFWLDADGNNSGWGDNGYIYYEMDGTTLTYGHFPGHCEAGKAYEMRPTLVYVLNGVTYTASIKITMKF